MQYCKLYNIISGYIELEEQNKELVRTVFKYEFAEKGKTLISSGEYTDKAFFIISGYLKYFKMLDSGKELIIHLYSPDNFAISLNSFFLGTKAEESLQAITDCEYLWITKSDLEKLYSTSYEWHNFGRKLLESALIEKEERVIDQLTLTGQDKYMKLLKNHPDILQNVPVKYIASFIGIEPESLSRIRKMN
ncbi:Crp/Fnr family transcriptional regulator [Dysgonomonas macrotermitis]|uniref:cAMP-binding domain of CRP or a regulatory subunit of cAMP-dependent protein kinases n=1 Tax=Dysgonomonas macrotermitis TaxID=1346286 RepID=A0A1M4T6A1_9BACT|nr:Crp/Fnr family transcriptional regulator [Dysgonomonas macrotermitis]SHE39971.1 cAMP-binding domain of CRP or a regulatory subunit of cAMP-dependent protein kinases [Dysgonomonas macrotermitis]